MTIPEKLLRDMPPLYATEHVPAHEKVALVKLFALCSRGTWYLCEYDGTDIIFGYVVSPLGRDCDEWGYSSRAELEELMRAGYIEVDVHWSARPIPEVAKKHG